MTEQVEEVVEEELVCKLIDMMNEEGIPCDVRTGLVLISMGVTALKVSGYTIQQIKDRIGLAIDRSVVVLAEQSKKAN